MYQNSQLSDSNFIKKNSKVLKTLAANPQFFKKRVCVKYVNNQE